MLLLLRSLLDVEGPPPGPPSVPASAGPGSASRSSGPDAQVSLADYRRRFGALPAAPEANEATSKRRRNQRALALILCALAVESR